MMAYCVIPFWIQIHADDIKPDGAILKFELPGNLRGKRCKLSLLGCVDVYFGSRGLLVGVFRIGKCAGFDFDEHDGSAVR